MTDDKDMIELSRKWRNEAAQHREAAAELEREDEDGTIAEQMLHQESARVYEKCADELLRQLTLPF